jgi:hypothetical protein
VNPADRSSIRTSNSTLPSADASARAYAMGAERDPGETTTCCTPPSTNTPTAIRAAASALSWVPAPESASGVLTEETPGVLSGASSEEVSGAVLEAGSGVVSGEGSFSEVTKPVCHPGRSRI